MTIWYLARVINVLPYGFLTLGSACLLFFPVLAFAADKCPSYRPITSLKYSIKPTKYVRDVSARELTDANLELAGADIILGHAGGYSSMRFTVKYEAVHLRALQYCLQIKKIKAQFYAEPMIHIASNFKRGSCEYNKVLRHEREHVKILHRAHKSYISKYRSHLRKLAREMPYFSPLRLQDIKKHTDIAEHHIHDGLEEYMTKITKYVSERQKELDTPEEYLRIQRKCRRWDKKLKDD
ncbi:MAG: hypothetical protein COA45_04470 [Zetaproteobacteria bacterium]|nr:MAG: hypothetical protein COA45_04470 [Zetaproteobacteria bacterium]